MRAKAFGSILRWALSALSSADFFLALFGASGVTGLNIYSMIVAIIGASWCC